MTKKVQPKELSTLADVAWHRWLKTWQGAAYTIKGDPEQMNVARRLFMMGFYANPFTDYDQEYERPILNYQHTVHKQWIKFMIDEYQNPTHQKIAQLLGLSVDTVHKMIREIARDKSSQASA